MNNIIVYCETDGGHLCDVSLELLTKARDLAAVLSCDVEALLIGYNVRGLADELYAYGAKTVHLAEDPRLEHFRTLPYAADKRLEFFRTLPYASITIDLFRKEQPQIALFGATSVGRDLAPRVSSALHSGLTADCTSLEIGDHQDKEKQYHNLLYQIRPAFGSGQGEAVPQPSVPDPPRIRRQYHSHYRQSRAQATDGHCARGCDEEGSFSVSRGRQDFRDRRRIHR